MPPEDRKAVAGILVGLAGSGVTMAGPLAFPNAPPAVWQFLFLAFGLAVAISLLVLANDYFIGPRGKRLDPFLALAICATLVALGSLLIFVVRAPTPTKAGAAVAPQGQPVLSLLPPKDRYSFKWDPTTGMYFDIQREGQKLPAGHTANPGFILHNSSPVAAADVVVKWRADISEFQQLAKVGRLAKYDVKFTDNSTLDLISGDSKHPVPAYRYYPSPTAEERFAFVARNTDVYLPLSIYPLLGLFITAKMPDQIGSKTEAFPIAISATWSVPDGGQPVSFRVKIRAVSTKANAPSDPPEVAGYLEFEIE
jgi:hypothetical protein